MTDAPLIAREKFFGNPNRARVRISSDGQWLAFLAPREGVLNVWVAPVGDLEAARPVTRDVHRGIRSFDWAYNNSHILYVQDQDGDEDFHVYSVDLASDAIRDLTPLTGIAARIEALSEQFPDEIVVGVNDRDEHYFHDLYRVHVATGERTLLQLNPGFAGFLTDRDYRVRFAVTITPDGGQLYLRNDGPADDPQEQWRPYLEVGPEDAMTTGPTGFSKDSQRLYLVDSRQRDTAALMTLDLASGQLDLIADNPRADVSGIMLHPRDKTVQAVSFEHLRETWRVLDEDITADIEYLNGLTDGELQVTSRTLDDTIWTVAFGRDDGPMDFYVYDRRTRQARFLFPSDPELAELPLVKMRPLTITARDGLELVSYLSLPASAGSDKGVRPARPLPLVLLVHGGPFARDSWGYDSEHQLLANRGYAVLSVNYRGSTGFGKAFINAANHQWAAKMHDDLIDAVEWTVREGVAQRDKVAIMGGSYGGYAALVGLTFTPETFACGVDLVGPSNLITLLENPPPYWMPILPLLTSRIGDVSQPEGRALLEARSPLNRVEQIRRPLLIGQGKNDPRVKQQESDQIVEAMREKGIPVTYMLFQEEGHGFARPENRYAFYAVAEAFLAQHLGGRFQPVGDAFQQAVFTIPSGADQTPGVGEALPDRDGP